MKVLHILGTGRPGGVETFVLQLVQQSSAHNARASVCILGPDGPIVQQLEEAGASVTRLHASRRSRTRNAFELNHLLRKERFDIVHAHAGGRVHRLLAKASGAVVISHLHGLDEHWLRAIDGKDGQLKRLVKSFGVGADEIAVSSDWMMSIVVRGEPRKAVSLLRYGVDTAVFNPANRAVAQADARTAWGIGSTTKVCGFVGRLVRQKGVEHFLALARLLRKEDVHFVVVGDGPLRESSEALARAGDLGNVTFAGESSNTARQIAAFDVTVVPSAWEPFGIVCIESMSCGVPVVALDVGGIKESVSDLETGFLVEQGDDEALASAVYRILSDSDLAARFGDAGRQRVLSGFDLKVTTAAVYQHYSDLLARHARKSLNR